MYPNQGNRYCSLFRSALAFCCIVIILISGLTVSSYASTDCTAEIRHIQAVQAGSEPAQVPQQGWQMVQLPDHWQKRWKNYDGHVWYRINWDYLCPTSQRTSIALAVHSINMAGQVYLNQQLLWQDQSLQEPLSRSWNMPRYWVFPAAALHQGQNTILIRVTGIAAQSPGLGKIYLAQPALAFQHYQQQWWYQRFSHLIRLICSIMLGILCFSIWVLRRQETAFGWFALACVFWSFFTYYLLSTDPAPFIHTFDVARANIMFLLCYVVCFIIYTWRFSGKIYPKFEKFIWFSVAVFAVLVLILPVQQLNWLLKLILIYTISGFILNCLFYPYIVYHSKQIEQYLLALCLILYLILGLYNLYLFLGNSEINYFSVIYTTPVTVIFISVTLAMRLVRNMKMIEAFNETLEQKVITVKAELNDSLSTQHQLELTNIKLQERINLAHDLHDSLGGALVRSIAMIDQSHNNLSNQQFLSILKLLRDDLRQVIDHGSSNGVKVPELPVLWGAPIRHRFDQLFEELDIHSEWYFPEQWGFQPTPLECLTLLRIAEEALTNIIKHSQAQNVKIALHFSGQQLIFKIEDDGIGFDVEAVKQSGISIGMQSMHMRMEQLHGQFKIHSQSGYTCLSATLTRMI